MIIAIIKGLRNGLIVAIFSIIGWILGLYAAIKFSDTAAKYLEGSLNLSPRWLSVISFILVFSLVIFLVNLGAKLIEKTVELGMMGWLNKLGGIFFYLLLYVLIFSVIIYFAEKARLLNEEFASSSKVYNYLQPIVLKLKQLF